MTTATTETQEARAAAFRRGDGLLAVAASRTTKEGLGTRTEEKDGCMDGSDEGAGRGRLKRPRGSRGNSEEIEEDKGAGVCGLGAGVCFV